ncbi:MAG: Ail/Lom family outer membrane beta-barrel protein [Symbiopectobacterium sp.]
MKYYSPLVGPSYRVNEFVSLYGLAGVAHSKAKLSGSYDDDACISYSCCKRCATSGPLLVRLRSVSSALSKSAGPPHSPQTDKYRR